MTRRTLWLANGLLPLALLAILLLRDLSIVTAPSLQFEEGTRLFAYFYSHPGLEALFQPYNGFIALLPNLMGFVAAKLPTRLIPYGLTLLPLLFTLVTYIQFSRSDYRCYVRSDLLRALACLLFALAPLTQYEQIATSHYAHWNALFLLILLMLLPAPLGLLKQLCQGLLSILLIWSSPLSIATAPLALDSIRRERVSRPYHLSLTAGLILYQIFGVSHGNSTARSIPQPLLAGLKSLIASLTDSARLLFRTLFGPQAYQQLAWTGVVGTLIAIGLAVLAGASLTLYFRSPGVERKRFTLFLLYLVFALTWFSGLGRGFDYVGLFNVHPRYIYVQSFLLLMLLVATIEAVLDQADSFVFQLWGRRWVSGWLLLSYGAMNLQMGYYQFSSLGSSEINPYGQSREESQRATRFFEDLAIAERAQVKPAPLLGIDRGPKWSFQVRVRQR